MRGQSTKGFTIVELLIVIVIIGILAAITIVAYGNIQQRAKDAKTVSTISTYIKGLALYAAQNGSYPGGQSTVCLDGTSSCWGGANAIDSQASKTALSSVMSSFPPFEDMAFAYNTQPSPNGDVTGYYIAFIIQGDSCPKIGGTVFLNKTGSAGSYRCRVSLPNPS